MTGMTAKLFLANLLSVQVLF